MRKDVINQLCEEKSIEKTDISYGWISILKKNGIEVKIINNNFYLNSGVSVELASDKYSTYQILSRNNIPIVKYDILCNEKFRDFNLINNDFEILKNDDKTVIKAIDSNQGNDVYLCCTQDEKFKVVNKLFDKGNTTICICPYIDIKYEYRAIFFNGDIIYIYKKEKPYVIGDGKSNIGTLIKNIKYFRDSIKKLDMDYIPKLGEKVVVGWKHNLSRGAVPIVIDETDLYYNDVEKIALDAGKAIEIKFAAIDIVLTEEGKLQVIEINGNNVSVEKFCELVPNGEIIQKEIYSKILNYLFEGEKNENK